MSLLFCASLSAQQIAYPWAAGANQAGDFLNVKDIASDQSGNCYLLLSFSEPFTLKGVSAGSMGGTDIAVVKMNRDGDALWIASAGGANDDEATCITTDNAGNIYIGGSYIGAATFGSVQVASEAPDDDSRKEFFVARLNAQGEWTWVKQQNGTAFSEIVDIDCDAQGNIYAAGNFSQNSLIIGTTELFPEENLPFVIKYNSSGTPLWLRGAETYFGARADAIAVAPNGNIYLGGSFGTFEMDSVTIRFGSIELVNKGDIEIGRTGADMYVAALNADGDFIWAVNAGNLLYEVSVTGLAADEQSRVYVTGTFQDSLFAGDFVLDAVGEEGDIDLYAAQLSSTGEWIWVSGAGSTIDDSGARLASYGEYIYMYGSVGSESLQLGPHTFTREEGGSYLSMLYHDGSWLWAFPQADLAAIAAFEFNKFFIGGRFTEEFSLDSITLTPTGPSADIYVARLDYTTAGPDAIATAATTTSAMVFPNPFENTLNITGKGFKPESVIVTDISGRFVPANITGTANGVQLSGGFTSGVYFLSVDGENGTETFRIIRR